ARGKQPLHQCAADESGSPCDQNLPVDHIATFPPSAVALGTRTRTAAARRWFFLSSFTPHMNQRKYSTVHGPRRNVDLPPYSLSMETIGTSPRRSPATCALIAISNATAHPTGRAS